MNPVKQLISDTLQWIQESHFPPVLLTSKENALFFSSPAVKTAPPLKPYAAPIQKAAVFKEQKQPIVKSEPPPLPKQEPLPAPSLKKTIEKVHPHFMLIDEVPDDAAAKKKESGPIAHVMIFYFGQSPKELDFLKKMAKAVHTSFAPTKLIDARQISQEKKWDSFLKEGNFKLIIAPEKGLQTSFELMRHFTEIPKTQARFLGKTPLLLLTSIDQYEKSPHLKRTLWNTLCQMLKS